MNINRLLCEWFDIDKKGYVVVQDLVCPMLIFGLANLISTFVGLLILVPMDVPLEDIPLEDISLTVLVYSWIIGVAIAMGFLGLIWIIVKISTIKIAKCERYKK